MEYALMKIHKCTNMYKAKDGIVKCKVLDRDIERGMLLIQSPWENKSRIIKDDQVLQIINI